MLLALTFLIFNANSMLTSRTYAMAYAKINAMACWHMLALFT